MDNRIYYVVAHYMGHKDEKKRLGNVI